MEPHERIAAFQDQVGDKILTYVSAVGRLVNLARDVISFAGMYGTEPPQVLESRLHYLIARLRMTRIGCAFMALLVASCPPPTIPTKPSPTPMPP